MKHISLFKQPEYDIGLKEEEEAKKRRIKGRRRNNGRMRK